jgi:hypothetical protein
LSGGVGTHGWLMVSAVPKHVVIEMRRRQLRRLWQMADRSCVTTGLTGYIAAVETQTILGEQTCVEWAAGPALAPRALAAV